MSQIFVYDITLPQNEIYPDKDTVIEKCFKDLCKKWVFQLEQGDETGYVHWQCRVSLIKKRRLDELKGKWCVGGHISPTSTAGSKEFSYVMKADTRMDGPWRDGEVRERPPLTRQLRNFLEFDPYPWQIQVEAICKNLDDRKITLILDPVGNIGKSIFCEFLEYYGFAYEIPPFRLMEDLMQCVMGVETSPCYIIDMPRAMKKDKLGEFYAGVECIKNGVAYDKRYAFKKKRFDRPQIIVFTNTIPDWEMMSMDRWDFWVMQQDMTLEKGILGASL